MKLAPISYAFSLNCIQSFTSLAYILSIVVSTIGCKGKERDKEIKIDDQGFIAATEIFDTSNLPILELAEKVYNFDQTQIGELVSNKITVVNKGKSKLFISDIRTSCASLQVIRPFAQTVEMFDSTNIEWVLNTSELTGVVNKSILLISNTIPIEHKYIIKGKINSQ